MNITYNGQPRDVPAGISIAALLDQLQLATRQVAVEVNLELVPRAQHGEHRLQEGDRLEVVSLVGGG